jgi:hypothetical protein
MSGKCFVVGRGLTGIFVVGRGLTGMLRRRPWTDSGTLLMAYKGSGGIAPPYLEVTGQLHVPAAFRREYYHRTYWTGDVGLKVGLNEVEEGKISCCRWESKRIRHTASPLRATSAGLHTSTVCSHSARNLRAAPTRNPF